MLRSTRLQPAPIVSIGAGLLVAASLSAKPDGADWEIANDADGCRSCHLSDTAGPEDSKALMIEGLPERFTAGERYDLTIVLRTPALKNAGFLLSVTAGGIPADAPGGDGGAGELGGDGGAGELGAGGDRIETNGTLARSTWDGQWPDEPGKASWQLSWTAPAAPAGPVEFGLWANAGNDDLSPLGDTVFHRRWSTVPDD